MACTLKRNVNSTYHPHKGYAMTIKQNSFAVLVAFCAIALGIQPLRAQSPEPPILEKVRQTYQIGKGMELHFDLEIYWAVREKTEQKSGKVFLASGDKFYAQVGATTFVSDGVTYWQYSKASNQAVIKDLLDVDLSLHPSQIINKYFAERSYTITDKSPKQATLVWTAPQNGAPAGEQSITALVDTKKFLIKKLTVTDKTGNTSAYVFTKTKLDTPIPPEKFTFVVPQGANVLDTRK